ncbi:MAG: GAF domain-containing protein [bacterium]|nr:GAF domain-containing protein [bacterium]
MVKNKLKNSSDSSLSVFDMDKSQEGKIKKENNIIERQKKEELNVLKDQFDILYDISQLLTLGSDLKKVLCLIVRRVEKKMRIFGLAAWLENEDGYYGIADACNLPLSYIKFSRSEAGRLRKGEGIVGGVVQSKKHFFVKDVSISSITPAQYLVQVKKERLIIGSVLCMPLFSNKAVIGVLNFYFSEIKEKIKPTELFFISSIANQVAAFIQNSKILRELKINEERERTEKNRLANLQEAVQFLSLNVDKSLQDVLKELFDTLGKALNSYALAIWKADGDFLRIFVVNGLSQEYYDYFIKNPISLLNPENRKTVVGRVAITQRPLYVTDFWRDPEVKSWPSAVLKGVQKEIFNALVSFPLIIERKLFGTLNFYFLKTQKYPPSDKYILQVAANTMAIAIGNAQYRQSSKDAQVALLNMLEDTEEARVQAEEERRKTEVIINNFSDGLLFFDKEDKLFLINPQAEIFFGIQSKDIIGKSILELGSLPSFTSFINFLGEELKSVFRKEFSINEDLTMELSVISMGTDKEKFGNLVILHDVTREKIIERLKTEFVSLSAHQLRTPLSAIKWTLRMLLDGDIGSLTSEQKSFVDKSYQSNERMISLVNDLLDVTRIEEGRYLYKPVPTNIESVIQFAIDSYVDIIKEKNLKIVFKKTNKKIPQITLDEEKMRLAVQNLIDNAVKYTVLGSEIDVSLEYDEVKKEIEVQVKDAGIGIPEDQQIRVFSKFFRAHNALKVDTTGSGLGLFIAKNIIGAHGGKIWFKSPAFIGNSIAGKEESRGTIVYFTLPVEKEFKESLKEP